MCNRSFIGICGHSLAPGMAWSVFVQEHTTGMSTTGPMFFPQINAGSEGKHVKDLNDSWDTVATNMANLAVGQQKPRGHILQGHTGLHVLARKTMIAFRYTDEILRPTVTPGAVGSGLPKSVGSFRMTKILMALTHPDNLGCVMDLYICWLFRLSRSSLKHQRGTSHSKFY